jgi:hypothetical protein
MVIVLRMIGVLFGLLCLGAVPAHGAVLSSYAGEPAPAAQWQWPLRPQPRVVRPFEAPAHDYGPGHRGVDLAGAAGAPVRAAGDGIVSFAGSVAGRPVVVVGHQGDLRTTYEPVRPAVHPGEAVAVGDVIGELAGAGSHCLPAACLHWGLRRGDRYLDPLTLLGHRRVRLLPFWGGGTPGGTAGLIEVAPRAIPPWAVSDAGCFVLLARCPPAMTTR